MPLAVSPLSAPNCCASHTRRDKRMRIGHRLFGRFSSTVSRLCRSPSVQPHSPLRRYGRGTVMPMRKRTLWRRGCHLLVLSLPLVLGAWAAGSGSVWFPPPKTRPVLTSTGVASGADRVVAADVADRAGPAEIKEAVAFPLKAEP